MNPRILLLLTMLAGCYSVHFVMEVGTRRVLVTRIAPDWDGPILENLARGLTDIEDGFMRKMLKFKLISIPREIMEKNRTSPPAFLEMALLDAEAIVHKEKDGLKVEVKLTQFMPSLSEVPSKELEALKERAIKNGFDFIDFWAVDFDWPPGKPFSHQWQDYRTRKDRRLKTVSDAGFTYPSKGQYTICVKVFDVFGCDTSTSIELEI